MTTPSNNARAERPLALAAFLRTSEAAERYCRASGEAPDFSHQYLELVAEELTEVTRCAYEAAGGMGGERVAPSIRCHKVREYHRAVDKLEATRRWARSLI
jgi:hypothetical protein